jgi:hypothetical protein
MAKERINPQFDIQRTVQPTAAPVDIYYRPVLAEPDVTRQLQIAKALKDLNPQLERFMSDAVAMGVAGERQAGRLEAMEAPSEMVLRRKATEWIEKEGGIAPWRYQSALETAGQRLMRDKYQTNLYAQLDTLSEPFNPDGTAKDPNELAKIMDKAYTDANIPSNSHYMQKGALEAKARIDEVISAKVSQLRTEKIKARATLDLSDSVYRSLSAVRTEDIQEAMDGPVKALVTEYYDQGYGSGDDVVMGAYSDRIHAETAQGNYDQARSLVIYAMENPIAGRPLGGKFQAQLAEELKNIEQAEKTRNDQAISRQSRDESIATAEVSRAILGRIQQRAETSESNGQEYTAMSLKDRQRLISEIRPEFKNISDDVWARLSPDFIERITGMEESIINFGKRDREKADTEKRDSAQSILAMRMEREIFTADDLTDLENRAYNALESGQISETQARRLLEQITSAKAMGARSRMAISEYVQKQLGGTVWTGIQPQIMEPSYVGELDAIGDSAMNEVIADVVAFSSTTEFRQKYGNDPTAASQAIQSKAQELTEKRKAFLRSEYGEKLKGANRLTSETEITTGLRPHAARAAQLVVAQLGFVEEDMNSGEYGQLVLRAEGLIMDQLRSQTAKTSGTANVRIDAALNNLPDIIDSVKPDFEKKLTANQKNILKRVSESDKSPFEAPSAPPVPGDIATPAGSVGGAAVKSEFRPWFGEGAFTQQEANVGKAMSSVSEADTAMALSPGPESIDAFEQSKSTLQLDIKSALSEIKNLSMDEYLRYSGSSPIGGDAGRARAFEIRPEGLFTPDAKNPNAPRILDRAATAKYWVYKSMSGYDPTEVSQMKTRDGVKMDPVHLDPASFLFFRSREDFAFHDQEYRNSNGTQGYIAERILPRLGEAGFNTSYEDLIKEQSRLIRIRLPLK